MSVETVSIKTFRETVEAIKDPRASVLVKTAYLLASRNSEILTKTSPWDVLQNKSKPYGVFMKWELKDFEELKEGQVLKQKTLVITSAVAKRGKRLKPQQEQTTAEPTEAEVTEALSKFHLTKLLDEWKKGKVEINPLLVRVLQNKIALKVVALPISNTYEPWTLDLLRWIQQNKGNLSFDMNRQWLWHTIRKELSGLLQKKDSHNIRNPLRHFRVAHLIEYYGFDPYELTSYTGWTAKATFGQLGIQASPNLDAYAHLRWRLYFPKLLKPIAELAG